MTQDDQKNVTKSFTIVTGDGSGRSFVSEVVQLPESLIVALPHSLEKAIPVVFPAKYIRAGENLMREKWKAKMKEDKKED